MRVTLTAGALATIGTILVIHSNPQRFQQALVLKNQVAQQNVSTRFGAWSAASRLAVDHPWLGVGPGNFQFYYNRLTGEPVGAFTLTVAHNARLDVGAPTLWLPWWIWVLAGVAIIAAGWYRRRSTLVLLLVAVCFGVFFVQWPEHAVWNTRFLPFWLLGGLASAIWVDGRRRQAEQDRLRTPGRR